MALTNLELTSRNNKLVKQLKEKEEIIRQLKELVIYTEGRMDDVADKLRNLLSKK